MDTSNLWSGNTRNYESRNKARLRVAELLSEGNDSPRQRLPHSKGLTQNILHSVVVTIETHDPFSNDTFSSFKGVLAISETKPMVEFCICLFPETSKVPLCAVDLTPSFRFTIKTHQNKNEGSFYFQQQIWAALFESSVDLDIFMLYLTIARFFSSFCDDIISQDTATTSSMVPKAAIGDQLEIQFDVWQIPTNQLKASCGAHLVKNKNLEIALVEGQSNGLIKGLLGMPHGGTRIIIIPPHLIHKAPLGVANCHITMPVAVLITKMAIKQKLSPPKRRSFNLYEDLPETRDRPLSGGFSLNDRAFNLDELSEDTDQDYTYRLLLMETEDLQKEREFLENQIERLNGQLDLERREKTELSLRHGATVQELQMYKGETLSSVPYKDLEKLEETLLNVVKKIHKEKDRKRALASLEPDCTVCMDARVTSVCVPCGHYCLCDSCAVDLCKHCMVARCPICRQGIEKVIKVYK